MSRERQLSTGAAVDTRATIGVGQAEAGVPVTPTSTSTSTSKGNPPSALKPTPSSASYATDWSKSDPGTKNRAIVADPHNGACLLTLAVVPGHPAKSLVHASHLMVYNTAEDEVRYGPQFLRQGEHQ
jgi:hypothetical protein